MLGDDPGVLLRAFGDPLLEQLEEQVGLTRELRVDDALGEACRLGDRVEGRAAVALPEEDLPGGGEHEAAVPLDLVHAGQPGRHGAIEYRRYPDAQGIPDPGLTTAARAGHPMGDRLSVSGL